MSGSGERTRCVERQCEYIYINIEEDEGDTRHASDIIPTYSLNVLNPCASVSERKRERERERDLTGSRRVRVRENVCVGHV